MPAQAAADVGSTRVALIDAARGVAIVAMVVYHFSWDLRYFGYIATDVVADPGWRLFARSIAGSFLALVGVSLVLAARNGLNWARFFRRLGVIAAAAVAITVATRIAFPETFIFFGILHAIGVFTVLALPFLRAAVLAVIAAAVFCFLAPHLLAGPAFDDPALVWLGLSTYAPRSNDFVPVFPWFGMVLVGMAATRVVEGMGKRGWRFPGWKAPGALAWAGRHSLPIYLVHQPVLLGLVYVATLIVPPEPLGFAVWHLESCTRQCVEAGASDALCRSTCACLTDRSEGEGLAAPLLRNALGEQQLARYFELAGQCRGGGEAGEAIPPS